MNKNWLHDPIWFTPPDGSSRVLWKDAGSPPPAPNYVGAAQATAAGNLEAAQYATKANRVNQYSPFGSITYSQGNPQASSGGSGSGGLTYQGQNFGSGSELYDALAGDYTKQTGNAPPPDMVNQINSIVSGAGGTGGSSGGGGSSDPNAQWSQSYNLSPTGQALLDSLNKSQLGVGSLQEGATQQVQNTMGTPFQYSGPQIRGSVDNPGAYTSLNTSGVAPIPQADAEARKHSEDMAYQAATSRLDPQWAQRNQMQDTQLRNQGLAPGSEAYTNAKRDSGYQQNDAYLQAQANAVNQGLTNQQAQFGMGMAANQAGFGQAQAQGQFANQGLAQGFNQGLASGQFQNTAAQNALAQQMALYNQPLNALSAIRSGSQVTTPQFSNVPQQQTTAGANYSGAAQQQGAYDQNVYNQGVGQANAFNSGLFSLAGAGMGLFK